MKLTVFLILVNLAVFFVTIFNPGYYIENYGFSVDNFLAGKYYVAITAMFIHNGILHIANNMIALLFLGSAVESKVKSWQYLLVYFVAGIIASFSLFLGGLFGYGSDTLAVGASGAIAGLIGLGTFISPGKWTMFPFIIPIPFVFAGALFFLSTSTLLFSQGQVAYPAHLFGIFAGATFGLLWGQKRKMHIAIFISVVIFILLLPYIIPWMLGMLGLS
jgi:membrane associated rhomboid family serine protease